MGVWDDAEEALADAHALFRNSTITVAVKNRGGMTNGVRALTTPLSGSISAEQTAPRVEADPQTGAPIEVCEFIFAVEDFPSQQLDALATITKGSEVWAVNGQRRENKALLIRAYCSRSKPRNG